MGGHLTDLKIWLFARGEEATNIKKCMSESLENRFAYKQIVKLFNIFTVNAYKTFIRIDLV
jgi:hypothetical protein